MLFFLNKNRRQGYGPSPSPVNGSSSGSDPNSMKSSFLSPTQVNQLRAQIMAYRLLARNQPLPQHIGLAAQGKRTELQPSQPSQPLGPGEQQSQQQPQQQPQPPYSIGQPFQRPPQPASSPMQPSVRQPAPGYPPPPQQQQQLPPTSFSASVPGIATVSTASPVPGAVPIPRPSQTQVNRQLIICYRLAVSLLFALF